MLGLLQRGCDERAIHLYGEEVILSIEGDEDRSLTKHWYFRATSIAIRASRLQALFKPLC